jgi:hypothetical protein
MAKLTTWKVPVEGKEHEVTFRRGAFTNKLIVDGEKKIFQNKHILIPLVEEEIVLSGKKVYFRFFKNKPDLAVDGVFLNSKLPFAPLGSIPTWANVLGICLPIIGYFLSGLVGVAIGILGGTVLLNNSLKITSESKNILLSTIFITIGCLLLQLTIGIVAALLLSLL